jgi:hypothetical protein
MTFQPRPRERLLYAVVTLGCAALLTLMAVSFIRKPGPGKQLAAYKLGGVAVLTAFGVYLNWLSWTSRIRVDDGGIHWQEGKDSGSIPWEDLRGWGWKRNGKSLRVGLLRKSNPEVQILPFVTIDLYRALHPRCEPLPPEIEKELKLGL